MKRKTLFQEGRRLNAEGHIKILDTFPYLNNGLFVIPWRWSEYAAMTLRIPSPYRRLVMKPTLDESSP